MKSLEGTFFINKGRRSTAINFSLFLVDNREFVTMRYKIFEIAYLVIAIISTVEVVLQWNADRNRAYMFALFAVGSVFMFFFRRKFRKKMEQRNKK